MEAMGDAYTITYKLIRQYNPPALFPFEYRAFEIKSVVMQSLTKFHGMDMETPYIHI